jgi:hypothetical protein
VKAVEITEAVHGVVTPRWSEMLTTPSDPLIVMALFETDADPSETLVPGALITSAPGVSVIVTFDASTGTARAANVRPDPNAASTRTNLRSIIRAFSLKEQRR